MNATQLAPRPNRPVPELLLEIAYRLHTTKVVKTSKHRISSHEAVFVPNKGNALTQRLPGR